jgi:hypothetical protein
LEPWWPQKVTGDLNLLEGVFEHLPQIEHIIVKGKIKDFIIPQERFVDGTQGTSRLRTITFEAETSSDAEHELTYFFIDRLTSTFPIFEKIELKGTSVIMPWADRPISNMISS